MKNLKKRSLVVCIILLLIVSLCGCRESSVLEQIIYTDDESEVDEDTEELDSDEEGEEDDDLVNEVTDDSDTDRDTDDTLAVSDEDSDDDGDSTDVSYSEYGSDNGDTTSKSGTGSESTSDSDSDESSGTESGGTTADDNATDDSESKETVTDGEGNEVEIPTDVENVAAVGAAAEMVAMVAGVEYLEYSNSDFISSDIAEAVFGSDLNSVTSLWSGDGTSSCSNFSTLLNSDVDVCFYFSGDNTLTSSQISQLTDAGISCVALKEMDDEEDLKDNVTIVGNVFSTITDDASTTEASDYGSWVDSVTSEVSSKVGSSTLYTIYISGWSDTTYTLTENYSDLPSNLISGSGIATAWSSVKSELVSTFMETAGVYNTSVLYPGTEVSTESVYVTPMFHSLSPSFSDNSISYTTSGLGTKFDAFVYYKKASACLGDSNFPAIIVANSSIESEIESNWFWQSENNIDAQESYGINGVISDDYNIYVNPYGICDWAEGCVESPLEAYWVAYVMSGDYSLSEVESEIEDFYSEFFECDISSGTVSDIIDGE